MYVLKKPCHTDPIPPGERDLGRADNYSPGIRLPRKIQIIKWGPDLSDVVNPFYHQKNDPTLLQVPIQYFVPKTGLHL